MKDINYDKLFDFETLKAGAMDKVKEDNADFRTGKSLPMTKEQAKDWKQVEESKKLGLALAEKNIEQVKNLLKEMGNFMQKHDALKARFWSGVELATGFYGQKRVNQKTKEIEFELETK